ncbi:MAG TPA: hypothetical protein VF240_09525 [Pyrinomonadaceae bacterium]
MSEKDSVLPIPQQEGQQSSENESGDKAGAAAGDATAYRKGEEDATMLREEERTGEGTGAKAGEYS